jgi:hypothetical protein
VEEPDQPPMIFNVLRGVGFILRPPA